MYVLIIVLLVESQFNPYTEIKFQEFSSKLNCDSALLKLKKLTTDSNAEIKLECVTK